MSSKLSQEVNTRFGNNTNINPFFETIVEILEEGGLYNNDLNKATPDINQMKYVYCYYDLNGVKKVVAIDVLIDAISRGIMKKLQEPSSQDAASNLSYSPSALDISSMPNIALESCTNINQAISVLAQEVSKLKLAVGGVTPLGFPVQEPSKMFILEDNRT